MANMNTYKIDFIHEGGIQTFWVEAEDPEMAESIVDMTLGKLVRVEVEDWNTQEKVRVSNGLR